VEGDGHRYAPWGFAGGQDGRGGILRLRSTAREEELPSKVPYHTARAGDVLVSLGPNGGGYGDPHARDPADVLADVLDGYLTEAEARRDYNVVIAGGAVDAQATAALRAS
jgi:N-methylhydantoinase B